MKVFRSISEPKLVMAALIGLLMVRSIQIHYEHARPPSDVVTWLLILISVPCAAWFGFASTSEKHKHPKD
jgi:hypothetical protein